MSYCRIVFLPSRAGSGFPASLYSQEDGQWPESYTKLKGVAVLPEPDPFAENKDWRAFAVASLREQGVKFIKSAEEGSYMAASGDRWYHYHTTPRFGLLAKIRHSWKGRKFWFQPKE